VKRYALLLASVAIAALMIWTGHQAHVAALNSHPPAPPPAVSTLAPPDP
jgi:hypothetical protein